MSDLLSRYDAPWIFSAGEIAHPIYSTGSGPSVVVLHELPGMTQQCLDLGLILGERFRVHLPLLFGQPGEFSVVRNVLRLCVSHEIRLFAAHRTSPLVDWLRALCRKIKDDSGSEGVGVVGMCLTGGFALALVAEQSVMAPVVAQPGLPLFIHKAALGLSQEDVEAARMRAAALGPGCVLGLRYSDDHICPRQRFETIRQLFGQAFDDEELPGARHATLTAHRHPRALERTMAFLSERLGTGRVSA